MKKYPLFVTLMIVGVVADLGTKTMAENSLASPGYEHSWLDFEVDAENPAGETLGEVLAAEYPANTEDEILEMASRAYVLDDEGLAIGGGGPHGHSYPIHGGEMVEVRHRSITVIDGFLGFRYVENRGAAWGFLSEQDHPLRRPFFITVGIVAIIVIFFLLRQVEPDRRFLISALGLIVSGAIGNIVDRVRYGYVVDFIAWHPGFDWPTFNIADSLIVAGVAMMFIEVGRDYRRERAQKAESDEVATAEAET